MIKDYLFCLPGLTDDVGLTNIYSDNDGVARRFVMRLANDEGEILGSTFAALLAIRYTGSELDHREWALGNDRVFDDVHSFRIGFVGPPGSVPRISLRRLLGPDADHDPEIQALTKGKVAIIASEQSGMQDIHLTPYARGLFGLQARMMSGAEVHANILETLLTGHSPKVFPGYLGFMGFCAVLMAGMFFFIKLPPWQGLGAFCAGSFIWAAVGYGFFCFFFVLPVANVQLGLLVCYLGTIGLRLSGEERERARLREIFGRYVSDSAVEEILSSGERPDLGGVMIHITVLFSDIRNFTAISEKLSPQEVVEMLNMYFSSVCEPIMDQGGMVDKFIGDAIMAVFGSPIAHPDHARRAVRAALDMTGRAESFSLWMQNRFPDRGLPEFRIGVGIHTGEAVVGNIGSPKRLEFTAIGDTVNIASRLEGLTKELGWTVVASADTCFAAGTGLVRGENKRVFVKGREEAVEVVEVLCPGNGGGKA